MAKLLFFLVLLFVVWRLLFKPRPKPPARQTPSPAQQEGERMVPCAWCGVNHPISESLLADGKHYCSEPHRASARATES